MSTTRSLVRLVAVTAWVFGLFVLSSPVLALAAVMGPAGAGLKARSLRLSTWGALRLMGVRVVSTGPAPRPPCFLVSNHLSYLDILVLAARTECAFVSKAEVARWPVLGLLARAYGTVFVERSRKGDLRRVMDEVEALLRNGHGIVFFPEATSTAGSGVLQFHSSLFEAAVRAGCPVSCASLSYHTPEGGPPAEEAACWWRRTPFFGHFWRLLGLPWVRARVVYAGQPLPARERKQLAVQARQAVLAQFTPSTADRGPAET